MTEGVVGRLLVTLTCIPLPRFTVSSAAGASALEGTWDPGSVASVGSRLCILQLFILEGTEEQSVIFPHAVGLDFHGADKEALG